MPERHVLYILRRDVINAHRDKFEEEGCPGGKGAIRHSNPEKIDFDVVESMLRDTVTSTGPVR